MKRKFWVGALLLVALVVGYQFIGSDSDGIEEGKTYALAATYKAAIKGSSLEGRVFDFADRNLPRVSILVPVKDERGVAIVRENSNLPPSSVRKVRVQVTRKELEGVVYPGYEYIEWQYHAATVEIQNVTPLVTPKKK
jgi:hypothetical protein